MNQRNVMQTFIDKTENKMQEERTPLPTIEEPLSLDCGSSFRSSASISGKSSGIKDTVG